MESSDDVPLPFWSALNRSRGDHTHAGRWGLYYAVEPDDPASEAARAIERFVFTHSLGYSDTMVEEEYGLYEEISVWILLINRASDEPVGSLRALVAPNEKLKIDADLHRLWGCSLSTALQLHGLNPLANVVECATISVLPEWRTADRRWPVKALCAAFNHLGLDLGAEYFVQLQDVTGPRLLRAMLGLTFDVLADLPPVDFLGPVQPTITDPRTHGQTMTSTDEDFRRLFIDRDGRTARGGTSLPFIDLSATPRLRHLSPPSRPAT